MQICYIQFHVNLDTFGYKFLSKKQIVENQFVRKTTANKKLKSEKNQSSLIPRYVGIHKISTKEYRVHTKLMEKISIQFV
jgi:hypothetical protein